jgi:hypothetical protein
MGPAARWVEAAVPSHSAGYDIVLLAHVLAVVGSLVTVAMAGGSALALSDPGPIRPSLVRYYRPGVNWAGRVLFAVPVLGFLLITLSDGQWSVGDLWIVVGLWLWLAAAVLAEALLWPTERRLQDLVHRMTESPPAPPSTAPSDPLSAAPPQGRRPDELTALCRRTAVVASVVAVILVGASVVMVAKP